MKQSMKIVLGVIVLAVVLWYTAIPQGVWLARNVYVAQTVQGKIEAVNKINKELNERLKAAEATIKAQEAPQTPAPVPQPPAK